MRRLLAATLLLAACSEPAGPPVPFDPSVAEAALAPVMEALRAGDGARALAALDELAAAGPLPEGALHYRGLALQAAGRGAEAEQAWREELRLHPGNGRSHALLAQRLLDAGRLDEAAEHLGLARVLAPGWLPARLLEARLALARNEDEAALRAFQDVLAADPWGESAVEAHTGLAQVLARRGPDAAAQAEGHAGAARHLQELYAYLASYRARLQRDPRDAEAAYGVATAYLNLYVQHGDVRLRDQAEQALQHVLSIRPADARALYNLGFVRARQGRYPEALELSRRAVQADPQLVLARVNLALLLVRAGQRDEAVAELSVVAEGAPETADRVRAHAEIARLLADDADPRQRDVALGHAEQALALQPEDPWAMAALAARLRAAEDGAGAAQAPAGLPPYPELPAPAPPPAPSEPDGG